ncbi:DASH complex subunit Dad4 [Apiospora arundinis]
MFWLQTTSGPWILLNYLISLSRWRAPHEHQQNLLLSRVITNVEKLNEAIVVMNKSLQDINVQNMNIELVAQMFKNYQSNVLFHLEATDNLKPPS